MYVATTFQMTGTVCVRDATGGCYDGPSHGPPHSGNQIPRKYAPLTHISYCSVGDPLVIISWLTNHNRNPNTSLGFVTPSSGPLLTGLILCEPNLDY